MKSVLAIFLILFCLSIANASIIHVPASQPTIQSGINAAEEGDTVLVAEDTYYENINFMGKAITVASAFIMDEDTSHISKTIIDGSQPTNPDTASVVLFDSGEDSTSIFCGFTITGGSGTLHKTRFPAGYLPPDFKVGGGIFIDSSSCTIESNIIIGNTISAVNTEYAGMDAGISSFFMPENHHLIIKNNLIISNSVESDYQSGGGGVNLIYMQAGRIVIENNIIKKNSVKVNASYKATGGGICVQLLTMPVECEVIIRNNIISENELHCQSSYGAGIYVVYKGEGKVITDKNVTPLICNNIITDNFSDDRGAAIAVWQWDSYDILQHCDISPRPAIINNTIVNNHAKTGNGLYCFNANPLIMNTIFWDDLLGAESTELDMGYDPEWEENYGTATVYNSILKDGSWDNIDRSVFSFNPLFADDSTNLSENSPAIGLGRKSLNIDGIIYKVPEFDFSRNQRPNFIDTLVDLGAIESPYPTIFKVYPKSLILNKSYIKPDSDYIQFTSQIHNPDLHNLNIFGEITSMDGSVVDSVELFDDGNHEDGMAGDGWYVGELDPVMGEQEFRLSLGIKDNDMGSYMVFNDSKRVTSIGPVVFEGYRITNAQFGILKLKLKNAGQEATAKDITVELTSTNPNVTKITTPNKNPIDIPVGQTVETNQTFTVSTLGSPDTLYFKVIIYSNGYHFWTDSSVATFINEVDQKLPKKFSLSQNYPNPFNPITNIEYRIPNSEFVTLNIYNVLGQKVATLVNRKQKAGLYSVEWDASGMASGVYYYRIVAGGYVASRKLILLK